MGEPKKDDIGDSRMVDPADQLAQLEAYERSIRETQPDKAADLWAQIQTIRARVNAELRDSPGATRVSVPPATRAINSLFSQHIAGKKEMPPTSSSS